MNIAIISVLPNLIFILFIRMLSVKFLKQFTNNMHTLTLRT